MIPVSVSDLLKILDQVPVWKTVVGLPKRLEAMEARIAALEGAKALSAKPVIDPAKACPICGTEMTVTGESPHPTFDFAGIKVHQMSCPACGHAASRDFKPGSGYT